MEYLKKMGDGMSAKILTLLLCLTISLITGCNFEIDTKVKLVEGSAPPTFEITGNGASPTFLMFGPYEGDYGKDGNPSTLWEIDPNPEARVIEVKKYSPFTYGKIPAGYKQSVPKNNQIPELLEGKEYHFYVDVTSANGDGVCFRIQGQKAVRCK